MTGKDTVLTGVATSEGIAIGTVRKYIPYIPNYEQSCIDASAVQEELRKMERGLIGAIDEIDKKISELKRRGDSETEEIMNAHKLLIEDEDMQEEIREQIRSELHNSKWAVSEILDGYAEMLAGSKDRLMSERADDMQDIKTRILRNIDGIDISDLSTIRAPSIIVAETLLPSDTVSIDKNAVIGIITENGGATSHASIIARSLGIPAISGIDSVSERFDEGDTVIIDSVEGKVIVNPDKERISDYKNKQNIFYRKKTAAEKYLYLPAETTDGQRVAVELNIGSSNEEELKTVRISDGAGLLRTEFLYMSHTSVPTEQEQFEEYRKILKAFGEKPVTVRTLDIGGDKEIPYLQLPKEENPFLGRRALRLCFDEQELFLTQLRAMLRASAFGNMKIMFPMVGSMDDLRRARTCVDQAKNSLDRECVPYDKDVKIGIMIEIPSAAIIADKLAEEADFACIGTNDLCQYLTAADRMNPVVSEYYQNYHPAMFRTLKMISEAFQKKEKEVCVCGEMGGDPAFAAALIGIGIRSLSMSASRVAGIKQLICNISVREAAEAAEYVQNTYTADEAEKYLSGVVNSVLEGESKNGREH